MRIVQALRANACRLAGVPALDDGSRRLTYDQLSTQVGTWAGRLRTLDCRVVGLLADNGIDWVLADLAALEAGITLVPVPPWFTAAQCRHLAVASDMDTLLVDIDVAGAKRRFPGMRAVGQRLGGLAVLARDEYAATDAALDAAPSKITFTSGSTGHPKGVCLDRATLETVVDRLQGCLAPLDIQDHLCVMPLATLLENVAGVYVALMLGATVHLRPPAALGLAGSSRLDAGRLRESVESCRAQSLILQPELLRALTASGRDRPFRPGQVRFVAVGGARVSDTDLDAATDMGLPAYQGYGLSECASVVSLNLPGSARRGSVGRPLPGIAVDILPDGEITVAGQGMLGYLGDAGPRPAAIATGDVGYLDDDGFLFVTGRKKHLFITSFGRNVAPEWPEAELLGTRRIAQACVFGEGRPTNLAVIVPADPTAPADAVADAVRLANAALPDYARVSDCIVASEPFSTANGLLTPTGKPRREAIALRYLVADTVRPGTSPPSSFSVTQETRV